MFQIGQEVICINSGRITTNSPNPHPSLIKGKTYLVKDVTICKGCGAQSIDIGLELDCLATVCSICHTEEQNRNAIWFLSKRFVPIDYSKAKKVEWKELVEEHPVLQN